MWITWSWLGSALLLGLLGGIHCATMCGSLCSAAGLRQQPVALLFGRALSYCLIGAAAGGIYWVAAQWTIAVSAFKPFIHLAMGMVLAHGLYMVLTGTSWAGIKGSGSAGRSGFSWQPARTLGVTQVIPAGRLKVGAAALGASLPLIPCGLLYSALTLATLSGSAVAGAATMGAFVLGSSPWLWAVVRLTGRPPRSAGQQWVIRGAGLITAAAAAFALWHGDLGAVLCRSLPI